MASPLADLLHLPLLMVKMLITWIGIILGVSFLVASGFNPCWRGLYDSADHDFSNPFDGLDHSLEFAFECFGALLRTIYDMVGFVLGAISCLSPLQLKALVFYYNNKHLSRVKCPVTDICYQIFFCFLFDIFTLVFTLTAFISPLRWYVIYHSWAGYTETLIILALQRDNWCNEQRRIEAARETVNENNNNNNDNQGPSTEVIFTALNNNNYNQNTSEQNCIYKLK